MGKFKESLHIALTNLSHNAVRSLLSILGVVIGIAAVITVLSIGAGANKQIMEQINSLGVNVYTVNSRYDEKTQRMGEMGLEDVWRLAAIPSVVSALPKLNLYKNIRSRSHESYGLVMGVDAATLGAKGYPLSKGRNFSPIEVENRAMVCMVSESSQEALFAASSAVGQHIFIENDPWLVVGVFSHSRKNKRSSPSGDVEVWVPLNTLLRTGKDIMFDTIEVQVKPDAPAQIKNDIAAAMERSDPHREGLFTVREQKDYFVRAMEVQNTLSMIGALVACVSLVVGGIGMMNVMLTSVAERMREIGIRRAVGARKKDILFQFLIESCVLSAIGGILGILFGAALARSLPILFKDFFTVAPLMKPSFIVLAVGTGVILGVVFGFYPAIKASRLSPSEALRTE